MRRAEGVITRRALLRSGTAVVVALCAGRAAGPAVAANRPAITVYKSPT